jgi:hypothetical protein
VIYNHLNYFFYLIIIAIQLIIKKDTVKIMLIFKQKSSP